MDKGEKKRRRRRRRRTREETKEEGRRKEDQRYGTCMNFYGLVWISKVWYGNYGFILILVCSNSKV